MSPKIVITLILATAGGVLYLFEPFSTVDDATISSAGQASLHPQPPDSATTAPTTEEKPTASVPAPLVYPQSPWMENLNTPRESIKPPPAIAEVEPPLARSTPGLNPHIFSFDEAQLKADLEDARADLIALRETQGSVNSDIRVDNALRQLDIAERLIQKIPYLTSLSDNPTPEELKQMDAHLEEIMSLAESLQAGTMLLKQPTITQE